LVGVLTFSHQALRTHVELLADGRNVTLRHAVPSDAPRISVAFGARDVRWGHDAVAFDDHGRIVGVAMLAVDAAIAPGWAGCGLEERLGESIDR